MSHATDVMIHEQRAPPIFSRAVITLGIGPHSSFFIFRFPCDRLSYLYISFSVHIKDFTVVQYTILQWHSCNLVQRMYKPKMCETEKELAPPGFEHNSCSTASQRVTILLWNSNPSSKGSKIRRKMSVDHSTSVRRCRGSYARNWPVRSERFSLEFQDWTVVYWQTIGSSAYK